MKTWVRKSIKVGVLSAGILLVSGATAAQAAEDWNAGVGNGTGLAVPVQAPINLSGNALGALGSAAAESEGGAAASLDGSSTEAGAQNAGVANGTTAYAPIQVPINISGNAIGVGGDAAAESEGGATAESGMGGGAAGAENAGVANGTGAYVPVQVPINICGNALGVAGDSEASCDGGAAANAEGAAGSGGATNAGALNGTTIAAILQVPVNVCGNAVGVAGDSAAACEGGANAGGGEAPGGYDAAPLAKKVKKAKGNREALPVAGGLTQVLPLQQATGLLGGLGAEQARGRTADRTAGRNARMAGMNAGALNGTAAHVPVQLPLEVSGNAVAVGGSAQAFSAGGASAR